MAGEVASFIFLFRTLDTDENQLIKGERNLLRLGQVNNSSHEDP